MVQEGTGYRQVALAATMADSSSTAGGEGARNTVLAGLLLGWEMVAQGPTSRGDPGAGD